MNQRPVPSLARPLAFVAITGVLCLALIGGCAGSGSKRAAKSRQPFDVTAFGATGDDATKDTAAFTAALDRCMAAGGGEVVVPGGNYIIGAILLPSRTTLRLSPDTTLTGSPDVQDYPLEKVRWEGRIRDGHRALISARDATDVAVVGPGKIVGAAPLAYLRNPRGPCIAEFIECRGVRLEGFTVNYERMWAIHPTFCRDVVVRDLTIRSSRANGDGIDVDSCSNVTIERCDIDAGDDAIALKSGRGTEGFTMARPTENVRISDCKLGSAFAGLAIGTEMSGGVRNVRVERCTFTRGSNSIFIKSRIGRGGTIENIHGKDLTARASCFLRFDLFARGIQDEQPVLGDDGIPACRNVRFENVTTSCPVFLDAIDTNPEKPVAGLSLVNVTGAATRPAEIGNVVGLEWRNVAVKIPPPPRRPSTRRTTTQQAATQQPASRPASAAPAR